jgi:hypothetical protein
MSRKPLLWRLVAILPLLIMFLLVHWCLPIVAVAAEPIITLPTGLQASVASSGPSPAAGNATPWLIVAQLHLDQALQPPFHIVPVPLNPTGSSVILAPFSIPATVNCGLTSTTIFACTLTPTGATWGTSGFVVFNIRLTSTDGHIVTSTPVILTLE